MADRLDGGGGPAPSPGAGEYLERAMEWSAAVRAAGRCVLEVAYGDDDERQKLDLYLPDTASGDAASGAGLAPVLMFLHGGYWVIGHKDLLGFMAPPLNAAGIILASVGYRLAPAAKYPQPVDDCRAALRWLHRHIAQYGGDPQRLFVGGHSAGGHLAALLTLQRGRLAEWGLPAGVIRGCLPVSGVFDVTEAPPDRQAAFLSDMAEAADASPLQHTAGNSVPFFLEIGEYDFDNLRAQHPRMVRQLRAAGGPVQEMERAGHNHFQISLDHADPQSPWQQAAQRMILGR